MSGVSPETMPSVGALFERSPASVIAANPVRPTVGISTRPSKTSTIRMASARTAGISPPLAKCRMVPIYTHGNGEAGSRRQPESDQKAARHDLGGAFSLCQFAVTPARMDMDKTDPPGQVSYKIEPDDRVPNQRCRDSYENDLSTHHTTHRSLLDTPDYPSGHCPPGVHANGRSAYGS